MRAWIVRTSIALLLLALAAGALVAGGRLTHVAELRAHQERGGGVEASITLNRACSRDVYYVLLDFGDGVTARHAVLARCR